MFCWICRIVSGDMILEVLVAKKWGWPGNVEGIEVIDGARRVRRDGGRSGVHNVFSPSVVDRDVGFIGRWKWILPIFIDCGFRELE